MKKYLVTDAQLIAAGVLIDEYNQARVLNADLGPIPPDARVLTRDEVEDWFTQHACDYNGMDPCGLQVSQAMDELFGKNSEG